MLQLWAYAQAYRTSAWRTLALSRFLIYYNSQRGHYGIRGLTPSARLRSGPVNNVLINNI